MFVPQQLQQEQLGKNENVYCMVPQHPPCNPSRFKSNFSPKVRWNCYCEKKGCCKTIGPPPKVCVHCPERFLQKHSRQVPVFFTKEELRTSLNNSHLKRFEYHEPPIMKKRLPPLNTGLFSNRSVNESDCPFPRPPSRMGLFRGPHEPSYEQRYKLKKPMGCDCDAVIWEDLLKATEEAGVMAAQIEKKQAGGKRYPGGISNGEVKDYIRSNAVQAIRMPARRLRRCYVDHCGVHLLDMSDSPYVLRPGFGKVPAYIYRRKMELLQRDCEDKRKMEARELADLANASEDIQLVDDMEKEQVIRGLKDYWANLLNEFNSMPLNDTGNERHREIKQKLEERMKEVEQDIRLLTTAGTLFVGDVKESRYL